MTQHAFRRDPASGLIRIPAVLDSRYDLQLVLDTGATHTTLDSNVLYLAGHALKDSLRQSHPRPDGSP